MTLARLLPMPLLSWWIYLGCIATSATDRNFYFISGLVVGTLIGSTDFVDGWLARKYGPTVLGGLLDPIADKVFIAFAYTPFAASGLIPAWACAAMFVREFFVTALRSAYEQRNLTLKTSYLGKAKTWAQMQGIGVMVMFPILGNGSAMRAIIIAGIVTPIVAMTLLWLIKRKFWRGALFMSLAFVALYLVNQRNDARLSMNAIMIGIVAITWISGADYLVVGWRQLRGRGDFGRADAVRLIGAIALPILLFVALRNTPLGLWAVLIGLAAELAVGGLDNLLSHHRVASGALAWGIRVLGAASLLALAVLAQHFAAIPSAAYFGLLLVAAFISVAGVAREFWRGRDYYMDKRIRDKAMRAAG